MATQLWSTSWCPSCGALTVHATARLHSRPDLDTPVPTSYLACPHCDTVTVSVPTAASYWAHAGVCTMAERTWTRPTVTRLQAAVGQARQALTTCPVTAQRLVTTAAPGLRPLISHAESVGELEECLAGLGLALNALLATRASQPSSMSMSKALQQLCADLEHLVQGPPALADRSERRQA